MVIYNSPVEQKLWKPRGLFEGEALVRVRREEESPRTPQRNFC